MDDKDRQLLGYLRKGIPFSSRPFEEIGRKIGTDGADVLLRMTRLREHRVTGPMTAVLDAKHLGYQSVWAAMQLPDEDPLFEAAAASINEHPGVVRSHRRFHQFNFWFTLVLPSQERAEDHLKVLQEISGAAAFLMLPAVKKFKAGAVQPSELPRPFQIFSAEEMNVLRALQEELQLTDRPFAKLAKDAGTAEADFLDIAKKFEKQGIVRRLAVGFPAEQQASASQDLIVWEMPEEKQDVAAARISLAPGVLQCVRRRPQPTFPYSLYAFFAAGTEEIEKTAAEMEEEIGKWPWAHLPVVAESKKSKPKYFPRELENWCRKARPLEPANF